MSWLETCRSTVHRWEVDNVDHFTVAYYFARFQDATHTMLHALGLDAVALAGTERACVTVDCYVRYLRELRTGDVFHIRSGVIGVSGDAPRFGHEVIDSGDGAVCTRAEQGMALVDPTSRARHPLGPEQQLATAGYLVDWATDPDPVPSMPHPAGDAGFIDASRDSVKPSEVDTLGEAGLSAYIHRFSAANAQLLAAFGMTPAYSREHRRGFSTFEFRLRLPGALRAGDLALVRSGLLHLGNSSLRILHRLVNARTGEAVATLEQAGVHLDIEARRPAPLPPALRERAEAMRLPRSVSGP